MPDFAASVHGFGHPIFFSGREGFDGRSTNADQNKRRGDRTQRGEPSSIPSVKMGANNENDQKQRGDCWTTTARKARLEMSVAVRQCLALLAELLKWDDDNTSKYDVKSHVSKWH